MRSRSRLPIGLFALAALASACGTTQAAADADLVRVVTTTEILADMVRNVGGDRITVESIVPHHGDPHSFEPRPSDAATVAEADVAFSNHLLLEDHAMIRLLDNNVREGVPNIDLAEHSERYGARLQPLVEDVTLDTVWLGLAIRGEGPDRSALTRLQVTSMDGPGDFFLYLTDALGLPEVYVDTTDGLDESDHTNLPPGAHTHLNWAFTAPGVYDVTIAASLDDGTGTLQPISEGTFSFAVGIDPAQVADGRTVIDDGHADASVDLDTGEVFICTAELSCADQVGDYPAAEAIIDVPNRAIVLVPAGEQFAFLGGEGAQIFELPQAVLGKHVHGEIDPHLWQDVDNAAAYVQVMADTLIAIDPDGASLYESNRDRYLERLAELDVYLTERIATIPPQNRQLVTTHDGFGYLAAAYDMDVAGFVVPNPSQEPSAAQVTRLTETIRNLGVKAVFLEPNTAARSDVLSQVAADNDVDVCLIYGDSFDENISTYVEMMTHNADELVKCLG